MLQSSPAEILFGRQALTHLRAVLTSALPDEGCALLLGERRREVWWLGRIWPCMNVWQPSRDRGIRFALDPREQLMAQKWSRRHGITVLGTAHSHPRSPPIPSATDRALIFPPALVLILGQAATTVPPGDAYAQLGPLGCWWLPEEGDPQPLVWRMED